MFTTPEPSSWNFALIFIALLALMSLLPLNISIGLQRTVSSGRNTILYSGTEWNFFFMFSCTETFKSVGICQYRVLKHLKVWVFVNIVYWNIKQFRYLSISCTETFKSLGICQYLVLKHKTVWVFVNIVYWNI